MKGKHQITVKNIRVQYKFTIERNITILRGESGTGKSTLIGMLETYQRIGKNSGISVNSDKPCAVLNSFNWEMTLSAIKDSIVFIDEGEEFVKTKEFAEVVKNSDNYYVIATRSTLHNLPYSTKEIYGIKNKSGNRYQGTKRLFSEFYQLYKDENNGLYMMRPGLVIVEDSNSGYQFFSKYFQDNNINCISSNGKSNIYSSILDSDAETILVIADGAAFGPELDNVLELKKLKNLAIFLPESFEWMILKSGLVKNTDVEKVLDEPSDYIESSQYFSWERFFTAFLTDKTIDTYLKYNKKSLNPVYLQKHEQAAIMKVADVMAKIK